METTEKTIEVLNDLIRINNDRSAGLEKAGDSLDEKDQDLKPLVMKMAHESHTNSRALAALVSQLGGEPEDGSSLAGGFHRAWLSVEALFSGQDRETILAECERGEDAIVEAYEDALYHAGEIDQKAAGYVKLQLGSINSGHDLVKALRDNPRNNPAVDGSSKSAEAENSGSFSSAMPDNNTIIAEDETDQQFNFENGADTETVDEPALSYANNYGREDAPAGNDSKLREFFIDQLKDLLWAEKELVDTLPKMAEAAHSVQLREAFQSHLAQTEQHVARLEQIFGVLGEEPDTTKCDAMAGIVEEGENIIDETDEGTSQRDVGLIFAGQKVEHYEIASYGGMVTLAKTLGYDAAASILGRTLTEEKEADSLLTHIAEEHINYQASEEHV